jgi:hypothetical protein
MIPTRKARPKMKEMVDGLIVKSSCHESNKKEFNKEDTMNAQKLQEAWGVGRGLVLVALILITAAWVIQGYCYTVEADYNGPGSEMERSMDQYRDQDNKEACDRVAQDQERGTESSQRDLDRAQEFRDDHGA